MIRKLRNARKMTYVLWAWVLLIAVWAIGGAASSSPCDRAYQDACDAGTALGVGFILFLGFCGFVVLSLIWFMTRPKQ